MRTKILAAFSAALVSVGALAVADGHANDKQIEGAIKARQSHMQLYAFNLGALGAMAKGEVAYDADTASATANNLGALVAMYQAGYWLPGSDNESVKGTRALPKLWAADSDIGAKSGALAEAVAAMQAAAGTDLASLQAAMGPLGGSCGGCHKAFRAP